MQFTTIPGGGGGVLPTNGLMVTCHFHDWIDYNGVVFLNRVTRMSRSYIFGEKTLATIGFFLHKKGRFAVKKM